MVEVYVRNVPLTDKYEVVLLDQEKDSEIVLEAKDEGCAIGLAYAIVNKNNVPTWEFMH